MQRFLVSTLIAWALLAAIAFAQPAMPPAVELPPGDSWHENLPPDQQPWDGETSDECVACLPFCKQAGPTTYGEVDYLYWVLPGAETPRLLASNPTGTSLGSIADVTDPTTQTLLGGNSDLGDWGQSGARVRLGRLLNDSRLRRVELSAWMLFEKGDNLFAESVAGDPILSRPFIDANTGLADAQVLSLAGVADGSLRSNYDRTLFGVEPLAFFCVRGDGCESLEFFTGYRYLHYEDELNLTEIVSPQAGGLVAPNTQFLVEDQFAAENNYHMLPLGLHYSHRSGNWRLSARGSVAFGVVRQQVDINGRTTISVNGAVDSVESGGLLALPSNIGSYSRTRFAMIPELNLQLHRAVGKGMWVHAGYTVMYFNEVVRAPSQIDPRIDIAQLPPATAVGTHPAFAFDSGSEFLHGLNAGIDWHY